MRGQPCVCKGGGELLDVLAIQTCLHAEEPVAQAARPSRGGHLPQPWHGPCTLLLKKDTSMLCLRMRCVCVAEQALSYWSCCSGCMLAGRRDAAHLGQA
jgi:hypothetical protein